MRKDLSKKTETELIDLMDDGSVTDVCNAIVQASSRKISKKMYDRLMLLCGDQRVFWNQYSVSDFAIAALRRNDLWRGNSTENSDRLLESDLFRG